MFAVVCSLIVRRVLQNTLLVVIAEVITFFFVYLFK